MRLNPVTCMIIVLSMVLCPLVAGSGEVERTEPVTVTDIDVQPKKTVSVMLSQSGAVNEIEIREYIIGCVAAEMPSVYHTEALKAQAVACYTYAKRVRENGGADGADITDNPDSHQGYIDRKSRQEKWGENFEECESKIASAVDSVLGEYMTFDGETVLAVYHSGSAGDTRSAESLWGDDFPYLISVVSAGDKLNPDYVSTKRFDENEFGEIVEKCGAELTGDADEWVGEISRDDSGYVTSFTVCGKKIPASEFRYAADLRSSHFEIEYDDGFTVTCKGYGHGVGMSQYGADYMARQGFDYKEILSHYYTDVDFNKE